MNDRDRLAAMLRAAMTEALERRAGLPRITIYDQPRKARPRRSWDTVTVPFPAQLRLPLYGGKTQ